MALKKALKYILLVLAASLMTAVLGFIDYITGPELSFSIFYLLPILWIAWKKDGVTAYIFSVISAMIWFYADKKSGSEYSFGHIGYWNAAVRLCFYDVIIYLILRLKKILKEEKEFARKDFLSGINNPRSFYDLASYAMHMSGRIGKGFSVVYFDVDDFKKINDDLGHSTGDFVLSVIGGHLGQSLRSTDIPARIGGDEFMIFMPETDVKAVESVMSKLIPEMAGKVASRGIKLSLSVGIVYFSKVPKDINEAIKITDSLMYKAKKEGKARVLTAEWPAGT